MMQMTWLWLIVGLLLVVALWETNRWLAAALVVILALYYLSRVRAR